MSDSSTQATPPPILSQEFALPRALSINRVKHPKRGGQNLSARYSRLERTLRGKEAYNQRVEEAEKDAQIARADERASERVADLGGDPTRTGGGQPSLSPEAIARLESRVDERGARRTFMGFTIPEEPKPPEPDECCMSGCAICVYDLYNESLDSYNRALASIRGALAARHVPESTWPPELRTSPAAAEKPVPKPDVARSAFEELEARLRKKHEEEEGPGGSTQTGFGEALAGQ
ncbi:hypothetical protein OBBRIDRAFT_789784 [Obba rivulosa]|uniref:Oxidoreductase-like domain-containing protein n=1 Tax=Obba rivulosa TaxID=1052685 RepID=A0A8E2J3D9_9APHY|nr:hypothetical protein OBBRIDRAFT_789784 [Obba rivulosa]